MYMMAKTHTHTYTHRDQYLTSVSMFGVQDNVDIFCLKFNKIKKTTFLL